MIVAKIEYKPWICYSGTGTQGKTYTYKVGVWICIFGIQNFYLLDVHSHIPYGILFAEGYTENKRSSEYFSWNV